MGLHVPADEGNSSAEEEFHVFRDVLSGLVYIAESRHGLVEASGKLALCLILILVNEVESLDGLVVVIGFRVVPERGTVLFRARWRLHPLQERLAPSHFSSR